jgi:hypothetical protein
MAKRQQHDLVALVHLVKGLLAMPDDAAAATLRAEGARIMFLAGADTVQFAGVRASSTTGQHAALEAWVRAANRKLDRQAIARMNK